MNCQEFAELLWKIESGQTTKADAAEVALLWSENQRMIGELKKMREVVDARRMECTTLGGVLRKEG